MKNKLYLLAGLLALSLSSMNCTKYLDAKPDQKLATLTTLSDMQALMDNYPTINYTDAGSGEASSDDYYLLDADWANLVENARRLYTWEADRVFALGSNDWRSSYQKLYIANTVLDALENMKMPVADQTAFNDVKGQALFLRAKSLFQVASIWSLAYDESTYNTDLGIPLRLDPDFNKPSVRATVKETFEQIVADLTAAGNLLPDRSLHVFRSGKGAAYGLMARICLYMRKYPEALAYADKALALKNTLLDLNTLTATANFPFTLFNTEVVHESRFTLPANLVQARARISTELYSSYATNDLRRTVYFGTGTSGTIIFKGSYEGSGALFNGVATDELYLTRAEGYARIGKVDLALADLNALLAKRWKTGTYINFTTTNADEALTKILQERRKELVFRGLRWLDIKRLNKEGRNIILKRTLSGKDYILNPNDLRYALAIPEDLLTLTTMPQNPR